MNADRRILAACAGIAVAAGCTREPAVRTPANVAGEWAQVESNGKPLPGRHEDRGEGRVCVMEVVRSVITLNADGTFSNDGEARHWCGAEGEREVLEPRTIQAEGTFTLHGPRGDTIRLTNPQVEDAPAEYRVTAEGVIDGDEMVLEVRSPSASLGVARHRRQ